MTDEEIMDMVRRQEQELRFSRLGLDDTWRLGNRLVELSRERNLPVAIGIVLGRQRVFHAALPGASADNDAWVDRKLRTVQHFGTASWAVGASHRIRGRDFHTRSGLDPSAYSEFGGGFPLRIDDVLIGAVAASGLPQGDDHALVVEALRDLHHAMLSPDSNR